MTEITGVSGELPPGKIAIIASRYNAGICDSLVQGSIETLTAAGYDDQQYQVIRVPGAWELALVAAELLDQSDCIAVITLGCVIKGETTHDEHINRSVSDALMRLGIETRKPIGFGLLTCNTLEQALQRSGGTVGNKGNEAAEAVLELLRLSPKLDASTRPV
ncbi:6,7-dimethyl-8-ribityllumazine synthase [Stieleria sp. TO1_6]|uniref:6,7-dimethyl-8-ribityllumazine synthase n=1 Tax=Stieleria tagensis TaxID=2956795 RepID=UPI00209BA4EF|nr:6,7-dimethyl-8-ribityllumazine synthase [Stieleria tagensis]MCO8122977.1 6,7-dimethyl-8-ribityllumazine synthase [Stieleria tagensis]